MTPEFSRPERLDTIGGETRMVRIAADADERAALARRFGLLDIERLDAALAIRREGADVLVSGRVTGAVIQACSVTGEPLPAAVEVPVTLRYVTDAIASEEMELGLDALDTLPIEGGAIDLGEAAAETLALALDPFPRGPGAAAALAAIHEREANPFDALTALRDRLGG